MVKALIDLGWLDTTHKPWLQDGMSWAMIQKKMTGAASTSEADLVAKVDELCSFCSLEQCGKVLAGLKWMGLFSDEMPKTHGNLLATLSAQLETLCSFQPGERDLVMLQHKFVVQWKDGSKVSAHGLSLVDLNLTDNYGDRIRSHLPLSSLASLVATRPCPWVLD
jgi:hypothetical protein